MPFPPGSLRKPGIEPRSPISQVDSLPSEPLGKPQNTGVDSLSLLQQIFKTQELNWGLLHCRWILYQLSYQGSPTSVQEEFSTLSHKGSEGLRSYLQKVELKLPAGFHSYPWRRKWQPTPVLLPGESHGQRSLMGYSPWGRKESDGTEQIHFHFHFTFHSYQEALGKNQLQDSFKLSTDSSSSRL